MVLHYKYFAVLFSDEYYFTLESADSISLCNNSFILVSQLDLQHGIEGYKNDPATTAWWNPEGETAQYYNGLIIQNNKLKHTGTGTDIDSHTDGLYTYLLQDGNLLIVGIYKTKTSGKPSNI